MSSIDKVNRDFSADHVKREGKPGEKHKDGKSVSDMASLKNQTVRVNQLIIEMHLKIQLTSKEGFGTQAGVSGLSGFTGVDLSGLTYNGKPVTALSQDEAKALISDDGFFSVKNTAQRIFDFAAGHAGDDVEKLQTARDAIIKGFKEAEEIFGGTLPDISYQTFDAVFEMLDKKIQDLGGSVIDIKA